EVAQRGPAHAVRAPVAREHALDRELRLAVRAHRLGRVMLRNRQLARRAVNRRARREDESTNAARERRAEETDRRAQVALVVQARINDRLADLDARGEVE